MEWLTVTLRIYATVFLKALRLALRNWPVCTTVLFYSLVMTVTTDIVAPLGLAGGLVLAFVSAACTSSALYLIENIVRTSKATLQDFQRSFAVYLFDVLGVSFLLWVFFTLVTPILASLPHGGQLLLFVYVLLLIFLNVVPELIYLGHHSAFELIRESYRFILENWLEWFPPNLLLVLGLLSVWRMPMPNFAVLVLWSLVTALALYFVMIFRGLLFLELAGTTRRSRAFKYRATH